MFWRVDLMFCEGFNVTFMWVFDSCRSNRNILHGVSFVIVSIDGLMWMGWFLLNVFYAKQLMIIIELLLWIPKIRKQDWFIHHLSIFNNSMELKTILYTLFVEYQLTYFIHGVSYCEPHILQNIFLFHIYISFNYKEWRHKCVKIYTRHSSR